MDPTKNSVKFNTSKKSYWEVDKSARSKKRKRIRDLVKNATEKLPVEFKSVEVSFLLTVLISVQLNQINLI